MAKRTYGKYSGKSSTEKLTEARQALFDALLSDMEREGSRWVKEWSFPHPPLNGVTGESYRARNTAMLMYAMRDGGFRDPRFATFKMASDKGCHIIKGIARLPYRALEAHARQQNGSDRPPQAAQDQGGGISRSQILTTRPSRAVSARSRSSMRSRWRIRKTSSRGGLQADRARSRGGWHRQGITLPRDRNPER